MCKWGDSVVLDVEVPASLSCTGEARRKAVGVDKCIADMVRALNDGGVKTVASCCGHGKIPGTIILADDQHLLLLDRTTAHEVIAAYGVTIHGGSVARDGDAGDDDAASAPGAIGFCRGGFR